MNFNVHYRFFDPKTERFGEGKAIIRIEGNGPGHDHIDLDDPDQVRLLERHLARAITQEHPQHQLGRLVVLVLSCNPMPVGGEPR